ncbi:uncharacterized protein LOC119578713 [Penaeus monodon]|uniref:uncharacterized protein LOC119578713 n=1 Tax=Penaeus monodon TaxID=6687 RepID=UPI0018A6E6D7|nr:uncharacterized protein LOC119578713 [Penaeus monodon]
MCRTNEDGVETGGGGGTVHGRCMTWALKLQKSATQLGLFLFFIVYTAVGAKIFQALEHPAEVESQEQARKMLLQQRSQFLHTLNDVTSFNESTNTHEYQVSSSVR